MWTRDRCIQVLREWADREGRTPTVRDWRISSYRNPSWFTIRAVFGSWNAGIEAAGLRQNKPGMPSLWTREEISNAMLDFVFTHGRWPCSADWRRACPHGRHPAWPTVIRLFGSERAALRASGKKNVA